MKFSVRKLTFAAMVAAVYAALTLALAPISYGPVQFRISEALCILPFFFPSSVWGLFVGCMLANIASAYGIIDIVFGSLATLLAALGVMYMGKMRGSHIARSAAACLFPTIANGVIIGAIIAYFGVPTDAWANGIPEAFWPIFAVSGLQVALGELAVMFVIGLPLMIYLPKTAFFTSLQRTYKL